MKVNLCGVGLEGFINIDISWRADKRVDLEKKKIPLKSNTVDELICISAINYFDLKRASYLVHDVYRVLKAGGVCRFGVQDMEVIFREYLNGNPDFYCHRINRWFGLEDGYKSNGKKCKYVFDYPTLKGLFNQYREVSPKLKAGENYFSDLAKYDNRPEQMFFLEARV